MRKTTFAGLSRMDPGEPLTADNYAFQSVDRDIIDRLLRVGAQSHRHDAHLPLPDPVAALTLALEDTGGTIAPDTTVSVCYTLVDADGGETLPSEIVGITTAAALDAPEDVPDADVDTTAGDLLAGAYFYAVTLTDGQGFETAVGPTVEVDVDPGFAHAQIVLSGLSNILEDNPGAAGWRLYKANSTGQLIFLAAGDSTVDAVTDDGHLCTDCTEVAPGQGQAAALGTSSVLVTIPTDAAMADAAGIRIYMSTSGDFSSPAFVELLTPDAAGTTRRYTQITVSDGAPPDVSTSIGGAAKIDPDTDLLDWHWKRPVATAADLPDAGNETGDMRVATDTQTLYLYTDAWAPLPIGNVTWGAPVASSADLPAQAVTGEAHVVTATSTIFVWNGAGWLPISGSGDGGGGGGGSSAMQLGEAFEWFDHGSSIAFLLADRDFIYDPDNDGDYADFSVDGPALNFTGTAFQQSGGALIPAQDGSANDTDVVAVRQADGADELRGNGTSTLGVSLLNDGWDYLGLRLGENAAVQAVYERATGTFKLQARAAAGDPWTDLGTVNAPADSAPIFGLDRFGDRYSAYYVYDMANGGTPIPIDKYLPTELVAALGAGELSAAIVARWTDPTNSNVVDFEWADMSAGPLWIRLGFTNGSFMELTEEKLARLGAVQFPWDATTRWHPYDLKSIVDLGGAIHIYGMLEQDHMASDTCPTPGELLYTIPPEVRGLGNGVHYFNVASGDDNGCGPAILKLDSTTNELTFVSGYSSAPATGVKPWICLDGISWV